MGVPNCDQALQRHLSHPRSVPGLPPLGSSSQSPTNRLRCLSTYCAFLVCPLVRFRSLLFDIFMTFACAYQASTAMVYPQGTGPLGGSLTLRNYLFRLSFTSPPSHVRVPNETYPSLDLTSPLVSTNTGHQHSITKQYKRSLVRFVSRRKVSEFQFRTPPSPRAWRLQIQRARSTFV